METGKNNRANRFKRIFVRYFPATVVAIVVGPPIHLLYKFHWMRLWIDLAARLLVFYLMIDASRRRERLLNANNN